MRARENKTKYAILGMLSFSSKSGYEISKAIENSTSFFWSESDGQLYPILKRLTEEGSIKYTQDNGSDGRSKKIYELTQDGEEALIDWLHQEPTTFNTRNEFLLQLFFGHNLSAEENINKIKEFQLRLMQHLKLFDSIEKKIKEKPQYKRLSLSYGQFCLKAEIAWCNEAMKILEENHD